MELRTPRWTGRSGAGQTAQPTSSGTRASPVLGDRARIATLIGPSAVPGCVDRRSRDPLLQQRLRARLDLENRERNDRPGRQFCRLGGYTGTEVDRRQEGGETFGRPPRTCRCPARPAAGPGDGVTRR